MRIPKGRIFYDVAARRDAMRFYGFRFLRRLTPIVAVEGDGVRFLVSTRDVGVSFVTFASKGFEDDLLTQVLARLGWESLAGKTVLEIGANIGTETVTMLARRDAERVIAIEPDPENVRFLRANLVLNGLEDRADVHQMALSDVNGVLTFELSPNSWGDHRVRVAEPTGPALGDEELRPTIDVRSSTLDSLHESGQLDAATIDLVWMDTQGHEAHVLAGAACLAGVPIVCEYWPYGLRRAGGLERFGELTAAWTSIDLHERGPYSADVFEAYTNLLLLPAQAAISRS
jgi:FkbM family methyltransferase